jgi:hypothetical protein
VPSSLLEIEKAWSHDVALPILPMIQRPIKLTHSM